MIGLVCTGDPKPLIGRLRDNGLLTVLAGGNVVRFLPPLITEQGHIEEALAILDQCCAQLGKVS